MKISRNISENNKNNISCISGKVVSCADRRISASVSDGTGHFCIVTPKGIDYVPQPNDDSVVISDENERFCIGVRRADNLYGIEPGELALYSLGGASIILKNDGTIVINGHIFTQEE